METEAEFSITTSLKLAFCIIRLTLQAGSSSLSCRRCNGPRVISLGSGRRVSNLIQSNCQSQRKSFVFLPDNGSKNILTRKNLEVLVQVSMELANFSKWAYNKNHLCHRRVFSKNGSRGCLLHSWLEP